MDPSGVRWLRKEPRISRPQEPAVETFVLRLARAVGIPAPQSFACTWDASGEARRGIVVRSFADAVTETDEALAAPGRQLQEGAVILAREDDRYEAARHELHALDRIHRALRALETRYSGVELVLPFTQLLAFDAWIGNSDRHQHNWAVLWESGRPSLAPMYDPAACLGVELTDGKALLNPSVRTAETTAAYLRRARSGFGDGVKMIQISAVVAELGTWPTWTENVRGWLAVFKAALDTSVADILKTIPPSWWPPARQELAIHLLSERLRWLQTLVPEGAR